MVVVLNLVSAGLLILNGVWLWRTMEGPERESMMPSRPNREPVKTLVLPVIQPLDVEPWREVYLFSQRPQPPADDVKPDVRVIENRVPPPGFRVVSMVVSSLANQSLVVLAGRADERGQVLRVGQERDGYRLIEVTAESAVFENGGQRFPLQPNATN